MVPKRCEVPISIVAVNRIDNIDWLHNELDTRGSIFMAGDMSHLSPHALTFLTQSNSFDLPMGGNEQMVIVTLQNVQIENVDIFKEASDEKKKLFFFQNGEIDGK